MSNEYKDWLRDCAEDVLLENNNLTKILGTTTWEDGYIVTGLNNKELVTYFIWQNEEADWRWCQI